MNDFLSRIDRQTTGNRCDVTPLFADAEAFAALVDDLIARIGALQFDRVAAIDALGFVLGTAIATRLRKGVVTVRKGGKLPLDAMREEFVDYTGLTKSLEIRPAIFLPGERVLIVDEWIETGAQIRAAAALVERQSAIVAGVAAINADADAAATLEARGIPCFACSNR